MSSEQTIGDPVLPDAQMNLVKPTAPVTGRVVSNDKCMKGKSASFVRHTVIDVAGTPLEGACLAGQSFGVIAPGLDHKGKPHKVRLYSVANGSAGEDGRPNLISTTPKRLIDEFYPQRDSDDAADHSLFLGVCSNFLCNLRPGDEVQVSGPNGKRFLLPVTPSDHDYLFLATGTGIAPFRGFLLDLFVHADEPCTSEVHLIMGTPYTTDLLYDDFFSLLAREHDNFHYHTAISRESYKGRERGVYTHDYMDDNWETFGPLLEKPRTLIYMCGLIGMQFGIYKLLMKRGMSEPYQIVKADLDTSAWENWTTNDMRRFVRPTGRMMVEVY